MRAMSPQDVDRVFAIEQSVQPYPWSRGNFIDALSRGYLCCVDEADGAIRGYAILMPLVDEAELLNIAVAAAQQRRGLGQAILHAMLETARAKDLRRVFLEVRPSNNAALALYRAAGFIAIGRRRDYYRNANDNEDAITMACDLMGNLNG